MAKFIDDESHIGLLDLPEGGKHIMLALGGGTGNEAGKRTGVHLDIEISRKEAIRFAKLLTEPTGSDFPVKVRARSAA